MQGWIKIHRQMREHWIFSDPEYLRAWVIILMEVAHAPGKVLIKGRLLQYERGESLKSLDTWGSLFGSWGKKRVQRFFRLLESDGMISTQSVTVSTRLKVENYERYQQRGTTEGPSEGPSEAPERPRTRPTDKNEKNGENGKNEKKKHKEELLIGAPPPDGALESVWEALVENFSPRLRELTLTTVSQLSRDLSSADFSGVDVPAQLRAAARWERVNPTRKKTARGLPRFLVGWVERSQNSGRGAGASPASPQAPRFESHSERAIRQSREALDTFTEEG